MSGLAERIVSPRLLEDFREQLLSARQKLLFEFGAAEEDLNALEDARETELEARSQGEAAADVLSKLVRRRVDELEGIQAALARIAEGSYGMCTECGARIAVGRLRAVPYTALCGTCAIAHDAGLRGKSVGEDTEELPSLKPAVPSELAILDDTEIADLVSERFRAELGDALDAVRVVCRHGVVTLGGEVPSEELREIAVHLVEDELDLEVVDRMRLAPLSSTTSVAASPDLRGDEMLDAALVGGESTEDIFEAEEEGLQYRAPARPVSGAR